MESDQHARSEIAEIKELFGAALEAGSRDGPEATGRVLGRAPAQIRAAVEALLRAHDRASGVLLDDSIADAVPADRPGSRADGPAPTILGYTIGEELGRGGFGIVYRAHQRTPIDRSVAVKVLRRELVSADSIDRFRAESSLLARLNHESIAKVYDAGLTDQGQPFVAMELIDGLPMVRACDEYGLGVRAIVALMVDVCGAIQHAHQRAVIHRDLKPANVLVERVGAGYRPKVIDFGIAKLLDSDPGSGQTRAGVRLGTPRYMSPEQRRGEDTADTRVDVYALGAMLCELLAGDVPSAGGAGSSVETWHTSRPSKIADGRTDRSVAHSRSLRGDLDRIVLKACAADPALRYPTAESLADDLRRYLDGRPINAAPPGFWYVARKFVRRHRRFVALAGVLGIGLVISMGVAVTQWNNAAAQRDRAVASSQRVGFIGNFLLEVLLLTADADIRGAPPALTDGTLQKIADRAAEGVAEDPEHMIGMLEGIGRLQAQAGQADDGVLTVGRALAFAIGHYGVPSPEVVRIRVVLYDLLWGHGLDGWQEQIRLADRESAVLFGDDDPRRIRVLQRADGSVENLERILGQYELIGGVDPSDHYNALFSYTMRLRFGEHPERQLEASERLYEFARNHYPADHHAVIDAMALYGEVMGVYAPGEETIRLMLDAYERAGRVFGADHFTTESIRRVLARVYGVLGRPAEGIPYALDDVRSVEKTYGDGSIQYANAVFELGRLYQFAGRPDEAREALELTLRLRGQQWSEGHDQITTVQVVLAQVLLGLGDVARAGELAGDALPHLTKLRHASTYTRAMEVLMEIRERAEDDGAAAALLNQVRDHLGQLGLSPDEIGALLKD